MWGRAARVRHKFPVWAASFRHVLAHVVGWPHRCVLCGRRPPIRLRRAFPVTGLLRWPGPWATVERRCQPGAVSGFPLRCLRSWIPAAKVVHIQERLGLPKFFALSLPACHGLRPLAARHTLANAGALMVPAGACKPSASAMAMAKLSQHCRGRGHPGGLQDTLSTLRPSWAPRVQPRLRQGRQTRSGWGARPDPPGTCTLRETPSFSWRDNAGPQPPLEAVGCRPMFGLVYLRCRPSKTTR